MNNPLSKIAIQCSQQKKGEGKVWRLAMIASLWSLSSRFLAGMEGKGERKVGCSEAAAKKRSAGLLMEYNYLISI